MSSKDSTSVDLGEDLLETTRILTPSVDSPAASLNDELQKGEIFMNERLFEDAKKVFWKVLRNDPENAAAKKFLDEIQKQELQDLLGSEGARQRLGAREERGQDDVSSVLSRLEKDLRIHFDKTELKAIPDLFKNEEELEKYRANTMAVVVALPPRERVDIGVAHIEMGLYEIAISIFESVVRYDEYKITGTYLLGWSLICCGKAVEATIRLEPLARDLTLSESQKIDFLYLMGMAFERLSDAQKAREFYRRVHLLNPKYKDVTEKMNKN